MPDGTPPADEVAIERARLDRLLLKVFGAKLLAKVQAMEPLLMGASAAVGLAAGLKVFMPSGVPAPDYSQIVNGDNVIQIQAGPGAVVNVPAPLPAMARDPLLRAHHYQHDDAAVLERRFGTLVEYELLKIFTAPEDQWDGLLASVRSRYDTNLEVDRRVAEAVEAAVRAARSARVADSGGVTRPVAASTPGRAKAVALAASLVAASDLVLVAIGDRSAPGKTTLPSSAAAPSELDTSDSIWSAVRRASSSDFIPADESHPSSHQAMVGGRENLTPPRPVAEGRPVSFPAAQFR